MFESIAMMLLLLDEGAPTLPRHGDVTPAEERPAGQQRPTDPLFDAARVAADDPAFIRDAIESTRQGIVDARSVQETAKDRKLLDAAAKIRRQNEAAHARFEALANSKGWPLPAANAQRASSAPTTGEARTGANFIVGQIAAHQATIAQYRAQLGGKGDAELKRALRATLPGYQENLDLLLHLDF